jgi:hypothetical protein
MVRGSSFLLAGRSEPRRDVADHGCARAIRGNVWASAAAANKVEESLRVWAATLREAAPARLSTVGLGTTSDFADLDRDLAANVHRTSADFPRVGDFPQVRQRHSILRVDGGRARYMLKRTRG